MTIDTPQSKTQLDPQAAKRVKYAYNIGIGTGILFLLITVASTISTIQTGLYAFGGIILTGFVAILGFLAAYLARHGKATLGSAILVSSILITTLSLPILAKGQGISLAVLTIMTVSSISSYTLTNKWATRATVASVLIGLLIILSDQLLPDFGIPTDPRVTLVISLVGGTIYALTILRRFGLYPLQTKIVIAFLMITLVPIVIMGLYNSSDTRNILTAQADANLSKLATETAYRIDTYVTTQLDIVRTEAQEPTLSNYLQLPPAARAGSPQASSALSTLLTFARKDPVFILSYALLDTQGHNLLDTDQALIGQDESKYAYYTEPIKNGLPYISNLVFKSNYPTFYFTAPIRTVNGTIVGVLRAEYIANVFQNIILTTLAEQQAGQNIFLIDRETYLRVAATTGREKIYHAIKELPTSELEDLQAQQRLLPGNTKEILAPNSALAQGIDQIAYRPAFTIPAETGKNNFIVAATSLKTQPWVVAAAQSEKTIYTPADEQARTNVFMSLGLTTFALLAALFVAWIISRPVAALASVATKITGGDLTARAPIGAEDEVGRLSQAFNDMTAQLSQTLAGLEQRVSERTAELETFNQKSNVRTRQLQSIAEVSRIISREQSIDKLLPLITDIVSERFGYYHVGIFLLDETRRAALLRASNSPGGQKMIANGHRLTLGTNSIVGYTALIGKPRIALDVGEDLVFFNNPNLPETHSEMALPLQARGFTIGVLDIQSQETAAFTADDVSTLSILADQIAIAIENARLFRQTQEALTESQAVAQSYLRQEWSALAKKQTNIGYLHSSAGGKALSTPLHTEEINQALRKNPAAKPENAEAANANPVLTIPIKLGEQVIGAIRIQSGTRTQAWTPEETNLIRSISERVGLALENARLIATSQKRAAKERTIGEISTKIGATTDMDIILQTAVQELGRILSGSDVVIQLQESQEE